jgi:hypothetical protein
MRIEVLRLVVSEPRAVASGIKTQRRADKFQINSRRLALYPARYRARFCNLLVQLTHPTRIARRRHTEQGVTTRREPVIEDWSKFGERPHFHDQRQPFPARQNSDDFDPREVTCGPTIRSARVHRLGHLFPGVRRRAFENFGIVVIQPLDSMILIERLDVLTHPATEIAIAVGVDFDFFRRLIHGFRPSYVNLPLLWPLR